MSKAKMFTAHLLCKKRLNTPMLSPISLVNTFYIAQHVCYLLPGSHKLDGTINPSSVYIRGPFH